jgi:hypothetical protein
LGIGQRIANLPFMAARPQPDPFTSGRPGHYRLPSVARHASDLLFSPFVSQDRERAVRPERLLEALEGRAVTVLGQSWRLQVYSVLDYAGRRWVQLALDGEPHYMLTLNLAVGAGAQRTLMALANCLANPSDAIGILNVA